VGSVYEESFEQGEQSESMSRIQVNFVMRGYDNKKVVVKVRSSKCLQFQTRTIEVLFI